MPRDVSLSRTANVGTVGKNGLILGTKVTRRGVFAAEQVTRFGVAWARIHAEMFPESCQSKPKQDCNYHFK